MNSKKRGLGQDVPKSFYDPLVDLEKSKTHNMNVCVSIMLVEAFFGVKKKFKVTRQEVCDRCADGNFYMYFTCDQCQSKRVYYKEVELEVEIPRSCLTEGFKIILEKESHRSLNVTAGDLNVFVKVDKDPFYKIEANYGLSMSLDMSVFEIISKKKITVSTIDNQKFVIKKPKYQTFMPNTRIKIKNGGFFNPRSRRRGPLFVIINVKNFDKLKTEQKLGWFDASDSVLSKKSLNASEQYVVKNGIQIIKRRRKNED